MEWYGNCWCISAEELTRDDRTEACIDDILAPIVSYGNYKKMVQRGKLRVVRQGKGKGNCALIAFDSLPQDLQEKMKAKYPDMSDLRTQAKNPAYDLFRGAYERDYKALSYYSDRLRELNQSLSRERIDELANEYATNASVIQAVVKLRKDNALYRKVRGRRGCSWAAMSDAIKFFATELGHTLGTSPSRFASWVRKYESDGYDALISGKFGNSNTLKVSHKVECLLMELACDEHRPFDKTVWEWYCDFRAGEVEYASPTTGELYDPEEFPDLSEKTVGDLLKTMINQERLSKAHDAHHDYKTTLRPYQKRKKPKHSLSLISFDDKDLAVKIGWVKQEAKLVKGRMTIVKKPIVTSLKGYFAYDVASGAMIGWAFSGEKDSDLFVACVRQMYRNLLAWGFGQPYQAQVENFIVSGYKETMMKSGHLFPIVTFAGAENSQEKYSERNNRDFKYMVEKYMAPVRVGRPNAKLAANKTKNIKVHDAENNRYRQKEYEYADVVVLYRQMVDAYNALPHQDQKRYPGMSRWEVFLATQHPDIAPINLRQLVRWAGWETETRIVRGQMQVSGESYVLSSPEVTERLRGRNTEVTAYYWKQSDDEIPQLVDIYQGDVYIDTCPYNEGYQVAELEQTREDRRILGRQSKRLRTWDEYVDRLKPEGLIKISKDQSKAIDLKPVQVVAMPQDDEAEVEVDTNWAVQGKDYTNVAWADL